MSISIAKYDDKFSETKRIFDAQKRFLHNPHVNGCAECVCGWTLL